jgi:transcriptional regulator with XRE-family HTH domain
VVFFWRLGDGGYETRHSAVPAARLMSPMLFDVQARNGSAHDTVARQRIAWRIRPCDVDRHVGQRIRMQRILVGMTQQQMAMQIGVSCQQLHKYERGADRITAGRLLAIARALDVDVADFFVGLKGRASVKDDGLPLELMRAFLRIRDRRHQKAICLLARALVDEAAN